TDVRGAGYLGCVTSDRGAVLVEHAAQVLPLCRGGRDAVPLLREASRGLERPRPALATDDDRRMRSLDRLWLASRVSELSVPTVERGRGVREQSDDRLDPFVEAVEPLPQRWERDAVGVALLLVPAGAEADVEPAAGHDVDRGGHVGQHRRVPVYHPGHLAA